MDRNECHTCAPWGVSSTSDVTSSVFQACLPHPPMMACFSVLFILCHLSWHTHLLVTWRKIPWHDNLQGRTRCKTWRIVQWKSAAKSAVNNAAQKRTQWKTRWKFYRRKTAVWDLSRLFSFRSRDLVGNPLSWPLSPEIWECRRLSLSLSVQRNPLSNVMRLNGLKDLIHPDSWCYSPLIKAGTYHDMR